MRKPIIAGNWKMNNTVTETLTLLKEITSLDLDKEVEKVVVVPFTSAYSAVDLLKDSDIKVGCQNMYYEESGAYTGEISPLMLNDLGIEYVIIGHSERREIFGEDDNLINNKVISALKHNINPILCCGETLEERENNKQEEKVRNQLINDLKDVSAEDITKVVIAYEPIWAIGTGKTASSNDAEEMCKFIRNLLKELYNEELAEKVRIQYGGSVKPNNVSEIMEKENIDGALVGGASLKADNYAALVNFRR
ncbi:triose-phosphate isomerase [Miniphocaeibacter halophilus]|uniref:Triose-phosphate isomerase n=1 Tax=Miniphocaeibacter halophilus TaxID=2931922 RepID=A0AC61MTD7_9FIRM|nr:triose-phosphate isomerase [Miniphocaeibacter halophilus]QQK07654.1 triose-phosphate isomerase [Miniphocaeibacter halophilus]